MRFAFLLFLVPTAVVAADKKPALPADWHGTWTGKLAMTDRTNAVTEIPIVLKIEPIKDTDEVTWVVTYGEGEKKAVKDYKLVPTGKPGRFRIDEKNGIVLDTRLVNGVLYSHFEVDGNWLTARYELRDGVLRFEVTSAKLAGEKTGGGKVQGFDVGGVQTAVLKK